MSDLKEIRKQINEIDAKMAELFEKRMDLAYEVADYKIKNALPIFDAVREKQVIENNVKLIKNEEFKPYYIEFINSTMNVSKKYQEKLLEGMKVAYCGVEGAFSQIAAKKVFENQKLLPFGSFVDAYNAVVKGYCDACVLPIENSFAGEVGTVMDLIFSGSLYINHVVDVDIVHNLIAKKEAKLEDIKTVASHPQALAQCQKYILSNNFKTVEYQNTAIAALDLSKSNDLNSAVIASEEVAKLYDLQILKSNINESRNNTTRFAIFAPSLTQNDKNIKIGQHFILVFTVKNEAGSLAKALNIIGSYNFNMRTLRSRPMKELMWNYYFFVEADGNIDSEDGKDMLKALNSVCDRLKVVGSYYSFKER